MTSLFDKVLVDDGSGNLVRNPEIADEFACALCGQVEIVLKGSRVLIERPDGSRKLEPFFDGARVICGDCEDRQRAEFRRAIERRAQESRRAAEIEAAGIPAAYRIEFVQPRAWPVTADGVDLLTWSGSPWCLVLHGETASGKTMLATQLMIRAMGSSTAFNRITSLAPRGLWLSAVRASEALFHGSDRGLFERLATAEVLLLDDLGRETSGGATAKLLAALAERFNDQLPTLITTNLEPAQLVGLDPAMGRRLKTGSFVALRERWRRA